MNELIRHIEYLVSRKDFVIIPGFGAVLAKRESAYYDSERGIFFPPTRSFTFNSELTHNDGLLACSVARAKCISYEDAVIEVSKDVDALRHTLYEFGELSLGMIGVIKRDADNDTLTFTAFPAQRLSIDHFWLPTIEVAPVDDKHEHDETAVADTEVIKPRSFARFTHKISRFAATLALLVGLYFFYCLIATPIVVEDATLASLAPSLPAEAVVPAAQIDEASPIVTPAPTHQEKYHVVIACFDQQTSADDFVNYNSLYKLSIREFDGAWCVSCGAFDTLADAETMISFIAERFPDARVVKN